MAATVSFMVSRIGPVAPLLLLLDHFGPIRDIIKLTVATTVIVKMKSKFSISELKTVPWTPYVKIVISPCKGALNNVRTGFHP